MIVEVENGFAVVRDPASLAALRAAERRGDEHPAETAAARLVAGGNPGLLIYTTRGAALAAAAAIGWLVPHERRAVLRDPQLAAKLRDVEARRRPGAADRSYCRRIKSVLDDRFRCDARARLNRLAPDGADEVFEPWW